MAGTISDVREMSGSDMISALHLAQQAPVILGPESGSTSATDTAAYYARIEQLMLACLRTGDDQSAHTCLNRLSLRFGPSNERIMGLRGLYEEATAKDQAALEKCLQEYDHTLSQSPVNVVSTDFTRGLDGHGLTPSQPILKRRVALLRSLNRPTDAISALIQLLDAIPTDAEAWCELADLYQTQGLGAQAIFSLEEALLIAPNSWNVCMRPVPKSYDMTVIDLPHRSMPGSGSCYTSRPQMVMRPDFLGSPFSTSVVVLNCAMTTSAVSTG